MKIGKYNINFSVVNKDAEAPEEAKVTQKIRNPRTLQRKAQGIDTWRNATIQAENIDNPNRTNLLTLYKDVDLDPHLTSLVQTRKNAILGAKFIVVDKNGDENEELTEKITKKWFYDFVSLSLESIYWGFSLIEFDDLDNDEFKGVDVVERRYVHPELGTVSETLHDSDAIHYNEFPFKEWNILVGGKRDLGLYLKAAPMILWKKQAFAQWAEFTETTGVPLRIGKTNVRNEETRMNMFNTLKDMGSAMY
jgi:phage gp29-like protein